VLDALELIGQQLKFANAHGRKLAQKRVFVGSHQTINPSMKGSYLILYHVLVLVYILAYLK
jgi:hypothetical protein